jgi:hypothetical protein
MTLGQILMSLLLAPVYLVGVLLSSTPPWELSSTSPAVDLGSCQVHHLIYITSDTITSDTTLHERGVRAFGLRWTHSQVGISHLNVDLQFKVANTLLKLCTMHFLVLPLNTPLKPDQRHQRPPKRIPTMVRSTLVGNTIVGMSHQWCPLHPYQDGAPEHPRLSTKGNSAACLSLHPLLTAGGTAEVAASVSSSEHAPVHAPVPRALAQDLSRKHRSSVNHPSLACVLSVQLLPPRLRVPASFLHVLVLSCAPEHSQAGQGSGFRVQDSGFTRTPTCGSRKRPDLRTPKTKPQRRPPPIPPMQTKLSSTLLEQPPPLVISPSLPHRPRTQVLHHSVVPRPLEPQRLPTWTQRS